MPEESSSCKTLWMLEYDDDSGRHLEPFYARSREEAEQQAKQWLTQQTHEVTYVGMRAYPKGFVVQFGRGLRGNL